MFSSFHPTLFLFSQINAFVVRGRNTDRNINSILTMLQGKGELATSRRLPQGVGKKLNLPKAEGVDLISDNKSGVYLPTDQWWRAGIQTHASSFGSSKADFHAGTPWPFRCFLFRR